VKNHPLRLLVILGLLMSLILGACGENSNQNQDKVTLQLNWTHESEFVGYYVAQEKGFYKDERLEIVFQEGGFANKSSNILDVVQVMADKKADFAVFSAEQVDQFAARQIPAVALMNTFQISPQVLFTLKESGIQSPAKMVGRKVIDKGASSNKIIDSTLLKAGIDPSRLGARIEGRDLALLYNGTVDVFIGFINSEVAEARKDGHELNLIFPYEYSVNNFEGILVTRQDYLDKNRDITARFMRATLRGWQYAIQNPDEAARLMTNWQKDANGKDLKFQQFALNGLIPLVDTGQVPIGWIDLERWKNTTVKANNEYVDTNRLSFTKG
jgi:NitT/TauT family transport system substrate-binding protein